ncbi:hypothetical protein [Rhodanobacter lindaniclasticus]
MQYVFASNGHLYGDYDKPSGLQTGPHPLGDFPLHAELCARYTRDKGLNLAAPEAAVLFQADSPAWNRSRYYQDAAIRAAFEKILAERAAGHAPRVLLSLATGAGRQRHQLIDHLLGDNFSRKSSATPNAWASSTCSISSANTATTPARSSGRNAVRNT